MRQHSFRTFLLRGAGATLLASAAPSCAPVDGDDSSHSVGFVSQAENTTFYELGFDSEPEYIPEKTVVLTFDDGPDYTNTAKVLDILKEEEVPASFFINRNNWSDLADTSMQDLVKRMVDEGHELANHTYHHWSIGDQAGHAADNPMAPQQDLTAEEVEAEIAGVEEIVDQIFGAGKQPLTLFRAPYGEPFQSGEGAKNYDLAKDVVAAHAVHIGWNIDSKDYDPALCTGESCAFDNVKAALETGARGIILMHSVQAKEVAGLPDTIAYLKENGYTFWTVEHAVCAKYGSDSAHLIEGSEGGCEGVVMPGDGDTGDGDTGDGDSGDGDTGDGDTGDGDTGDGDTGDGDTGDGDTGDGDTGDGDNNGDGDGGDGDGGDGDSGDGDSGDGDGDRDGDTGSTDSGGCSVSPVESSDFGWALSGLVGLTLLGRRRRKLG